MWNRKLQSDTGSAFVELALVLPLLTLVLIGAVELGRIAYFAIEVSNAARAGVAYGAQGPTTAVDTSNIKNAAQLDAADVPSLTVTSSTSCVCETVNTSTGAMITTNMADCSTMAATLCPALAPSSGNRNIQVNYVEVSTSANVSTMFRYPGIPTSFTLSGFSKMRVLN